MSSIIATPVDLEIREEIARQYRIFLPTALKYLEEGLDGACLALSRGRSATIDQFTPTAVEKTKFITHSLPFSMEDAAADSGFTYKFVNAVGYDVTFTIVKKGTRWVIEVEEKASTMDKDGSAATFATGNCYSQVKNYLHFCMRLVNEGNRFTEVFAAVVDPAGFKDPASGWKKQGSGNSGFDNFGVGVLDFDCVTPVFGEVLTVGKKNSKVKYCQVRYESLV
jgi:hypothetical protein